MFLQLVTLFLCVGTSNAIPCCGAVCDCEGGVVSCESKGLTDIPACPPADVSGYTEMRLDSNFVSNPTLGRLTDSIVTLSLANNQITHFTVDKRRPSILTLDLSRNYLRIVPDLSFLPSLSELDITSNPIPTAGYPDSVFRELGSSLTSLHIGDLNNFIMFPRTISTHLPKLSSLEINGASPAFQYLPQTAFQAFQLVLKSVTIRNTQLHAIPLAFRFLPNLEHLRFEDTPLTDYGVLPEAFTGLNKLISLSLKNDSLTTFPEIVDNLGPTLTSLTLDYNKLLYIRQEAFDMINRSNIVELSLKGCQLDRIPGAIADDRGYYLEQIQYLDFSDNMIQSIDRNDLHDLRSLAHVSFNDNPLAYVSRLAFQNLPQLRSIDLGNTSLTVIPMALTNIVHNDLEINLQNTHVECICDLACFQKYYTSHHFAVHGACETVTQKLAEYLSQTVPKCPDYSGPTFQWPVCKNYF